MGAGPLPLGLIFLCGLKDQVAYEGPVKFHHFIYMGERAGCSKELAFPLWWSKLKGMKVGHEEPVKREKEGHL